MIPLECPPVPLGSPVTSSAINRRVAVRHLCRGRITGPVVGSRDLVARRAPIVNISVGGLALCLRSSLRRGSRLLIQLTSETLGVAYDLLAHVRHCTKQADGKWLIGCAFARELTPDELEHLL